MTTGARGALVIYHTNDFHNHLLEARAGRLQALRLELGKGGLLLDAGDAISAGNVTYHPHGEPILERMSEIGYDAMTVGNREFHFSRVGFQAKVKLARFPVLCANVRESGQPPAAPGPVGARGSTPVQPFAVFEACGYRIAVLGLTVPMITERMLARHVSSFVFDDPVRCAGRWIPYLRQAERADLIVALTHIGIRSDRELAGSVPGIDLIVSGHSHLVLDQGERVGDSLVVQAGSFARFVGKVTLRPAVAVEGGWTAAPELISL